MWTNYPVIICINRVWYSPEALGELTPWVSHRAEGTLTWVHPALPDHWGITQIRSWSCADISSPLLKYPTFPHLPISPGSAIAAGLHSQSWLTRTCGRGGERAAEFTFPWLAVDLCPDSEDTEVSFLISLLVSWAIQQTIVLSPPLPQATMMGTSYGQMTLPVLGFLPKIKEG